MLYTGDLKMQESVSPYESELNILFEELWTQHAPDRQQVNQWNIDY